MARDEALHAGQARRGKDFLVGCFRFAQRNIVAKFPEEQVGVLHRKSDAATQIGGIVLPRVDAIDQDASFLSFIKTEQEAPDGGFSRSYTSDDAYPSATLDPARILLQH